MGRTVGSDLRLRVGSDFNSLAPCGANQCLRGVRACRVDFNSLAPCGANPDRLRSSCPSSRFQLTRPVWGEPKPEVFDFLGISHFNSLAPCGANQLPKPIAETGNKFQLTRPVWGEPCCKPQAVQGQFSFQLTRPVWGEPCCYCSSATSSKISTHSPRVGRTFRFSLSRSSCQYFNSLAPCGANPMQTGVEQNQLQISTHSPRVGRTIIMLNVKRSFSTFQLTRPVWGEPGTTVKRATTADNFNSLAPCGANLCCISRSMLRAFISTHSPRVGRTDYLHKLSTALINFNSLAPCGANLLCRLFGFVVKNFNSLAPCGANPPVPLSISMTKPFQLTRPVWGEPLPTPFSSLYSAISTHSPRVGRTMGLTAKQTTPIHFNSLAPCGANRSNTIIISVDITFQLTRPVWGEPMF